MYFFAIHTIKLYNKAVCSKSGRGKDPKAEAYRTIHAGDSAGMAELKSQAKTNKKRGIKLNLLLFLVLFPLITAVLMLIFPQNAIRGIIVKLSAVVIAAASVSLLLASITTGGGKFMLESKLINQGMLIIEGLLALFIFYMGIKYKKWLASLLILIQAPATIWFELAHGESIPVENNLFVDHFSVIMALIIGIIGSLICIYALGYMKDFHHHHAEMKDKRSLFFFIMFVFLSAMFGIVFANNLLWLYFFWEVTTLCSFILIGYTKTPEAINNSFRALIMNLLGGVAFAGAIIFLGTQAGILELDKMIGMGVAGNLAVVIIPALLISFAGITKAAQLPFSSWLLGAMVAPTPTSALLHSSTMVKAGVYIIVRLAPLLMGNFVGILISLVGGITFLIASLIAISQSNAKKVLAYSTVANLGLIVACAGIGTPGAVWAAILLIIFHAVAKSLLFLCVGTVEHNVGSRDIEDMDGLIMKMPKIAVMMLIGIAGMFLAPFGMLVSKWAALRAFVDANFLLVGLLVFGSAATLFFWTKWMGKIIGVTSGTEVIEKKVNGSEWFTLMTLATLTVGVCLVFPILSDKLIVPYIQNIFGQFAGLSKGNIMIMVMMVGLVLILPFSLLFYGKDSKIVEVYLGGANVSDNMKFQGVMGKVNDLKMRNYYMDNYFGERKLSIIGNIVTVGLFVVGSIIMLMMFGVNII